MRLLLIAVVASAACFTSAAKAECDWIEKAQSSDFAAVLDSVICLKDPAAAECDRTEAEASDFNGERERRIDALSMSNDSKQALRDGKIWVGANSEMACLAWGRPRSVNRTTTAHGVREQWVYGSGSYLYFDDGSLTAIQN
ncbi:hypothetical protein [Rhodospirillaceae bacterium SYSU D60014]|uniref:hypothetical protein n=1 Tax=Virgifigura deserti TaxID=2268457 RepID=UPI000E66E58C